ncbi:MAG: diguanylate cyclase, partial [Pseudomonadota bacterium]
KRNAARARGRSVSCERSASRAKWAPETERPLALAAFRLKEFAEISAQDGVETAELLLRQAADTARLLVRAEDFAARLGADTFLIAMPATLPEDGAIAVRRICGMLAHTRFKRSLEDRGVTIALDHGIVQHRPDEAIERTVAGALAELASRAA